MTRQPSWGPDVPTAAPPRANERIQLCLQVISEGLAQSKMLPAAGTWIIGRGSDADIRIEDASISRRHAKLHIGPTLAIEDLNSANGTKIHQRALPAGEVATVAVGEVIDLGSIMLVIQAVSPAARPRRILSHEWFEGRLEEACARAAEGSPLALLRIQFERPEPGSAEAVILRAVSANHPVARYAPADYEILIEGAHEAVRDRVAAELQGAELRCSLGCAVFGRDGTSPEALIERAGAAHRGAGARHALRAPAGSGAAMQRVLHLIDRIAPGTISVLILGETGVGKEIIAEAIHQRSPRGQRPMVKLHCAALPESMLEAELFGFEKGAFTGATRAKPGLLEVGDGSSVFLDEVGEMPPAIQAKLLRVLQDRHVQRLGAITPRAVDVRFIAATHRDLRAEVAAGHFREDLYYRLDGVSVLVPPLRDRVDEILPLANEFIADAASNLGLPRAPKLAPEAIAMLERYRWPGNVRELRNAIDRAVLLATDDQIELDHLPAERMAEMVAVGVPKLGDVERTHILEVLAQCGGNQTRAAKQLGISRNTLAAKIKDYGVPLPRGKK